MALVLGAGVVAFATLKPVTVLPRIRLAPGFALTDQSGAVFDSEATRQQITLYSFVPSDCDAACESTLDTVRAVRDRATDEIDLGDTPLEFVTIVLDDQSTPDSLAAQAAEAGADGDEWRFVAGDERSLRNTVSAGFKRAVDAFDGEQGDVYEGYVIVDGWGIVRGDYRYPTLAEDEDKLVEHLGVLGSELRNSGGLASLAYGAAHVLRVTRDRHRCVRRRPRRRDGPAVGCCGSWGSYSSWRSSPCSWSASCSFRTCTTARSCRPTARPRRSPASSTPMVVTWTSPRSGARPS
ncbi:MAG: SCO family protein [Ilumatobacteraceae bacterium]